MKDYFYFPYNFENYSFGIQFNNPLKRFQFGWDWHLFGKGWWELVIYIGPIQFWFESTRVWNKQFNEDGSYKT